MLEDRVSRPRGLHNLLQVSAGVDGWNAAVRELSLDGVDQRIINRFRRDVEKMPNCSRNWRRYAISSRVAVKPILSS